MGRNPPFKKSEPISEAPQQAETSRLGRGGPIRPPQASRRAPCDRRCPIHIFPRHALCDGGGYDSRRPCRFGWAARRGTPGPRTCSPNARCWRRPVRKTASMARKMRLPWRTSARHAGRRGNTGVRFPGGGAGVSSRGWPANVHAWSKFITLSYIRTRKTSCRNAPARAIFVLPPSPEKLVRSLPLRPCAACLCDVSTIIGKVVEKCPRRLCSGSAAAILRSSSGVELQSIVTVRRGFTKR